MTDIVSKIFFASSEKPVRSGNGLAIFCAFICMITFLTSYLSSSREEGMQSDKLYETVSELRQRAYENDQAIQQELKSNKHRASHTATE